jgi:hypothetical protein
METHVMSHRPDIPGGVARLRIHSESGLSAESGHLKSALQRLRRIIATDDRSFALRISDERGCHVAAIDDAPPMNVLELPPGLYQVVARRGAASRSYTLKLAGGATIDLHLRFGADVGG